LSEVWRRDLESLQSARVFLPRGDAADNSVRNSVVTLEGTIMLAARMFSKTALVVIVAGAFSAGSAQAQQAVEIQLSYKDKKFDPAEISAPANTPIVIKLKNLDAKAMEFESKTLHVEKVVAGSTDATINVRAQKPGRYEFFDEYNEKVARGALVVK
jgi:Cupredoxin-like domain